MLGVPLGSSEFTEFVEKELCNATEGDEQAHRVRRHSSCHFLLRLCATHFRTPLSGWSKHAAKFDTVVGHTVFQCLALKPTPEAYDQASVSTTIGGLGVRRIVDHARGAFTHRWYEAQGITHESWSNQFPDSDCSTVYDPAESFCKD